LGCQKQEKWMAKDEEHVNSVMVGVGAVVDFLANSKKRAPIWMQNSGLEWFYRLLQEPRRLFRRYLVLNTKFIFQIIKVKLFGSHQV